MIEEAINTETRKMYHSISEVSKMTGLEQHVLRYWESEFSKLRPKKNRAGNRQFRDKDIQIIKYIKHLLYNDMYTVQGAKKKLQESGYKEVQGQTNLLAEIPVPVNESIVKVQQVEKHTSSENDNKLLLIIQKQKNIINELKTELIQIKSMLLDTDS